MSKTSFHSLELSNIVHISLIDLPSKMSENLENSIFLGKFGEYAVISLYKALGFIKTENMSEKFLSRAGIELMPSRLITK